MCRSKELEKWQRSLPFVWGSTGSVASGAGLSPWLSRGFLGKELDVVAVNDLVPADNLAYLLKYDSTQGRFSGSVVSEKSSASVAEDDTLVVNGHKIKCLAVKEGPAALPWKQLGVEYVIESTGLFTEAEKAKGHITAGARKVIISAPGKGELRYASSRNVYPRSRTVTRES